MVRVTGVVFTRLPRTLAAAVLPAKQGTAPMPRVGQIVEDAWDRRDRRRERITDRMGCRWPKPHGNDTAWVRAVPGHGVIVPVDVGQTGGPRGCIQRWKVSVMIMRPPQHGQGGRCSVSSTGSSGSAAGGTASSARTRAILALRVALASKP